MANVCSYSIGKMLMLSNPIVRITSDNERLGFLISGKDNKNIEHSFEFRTIVSKSDLIKLNLNEKSNFNDCIEKSDVVFGYNGLYNLEVDYNMVIFRYLTNSFILVINYNSDDFFGKIEIEFEL